MSNLRLSRAILRSTRAIFTSARIHSPRYGQASRNHGPFSCLLRTSQFANRRLALSTTARKQSLLGNFSPLAVGQKLPAKITNSFAVETNKGRFSYKSSTDGLWTIVFTSIGAFDPVSTSNIKIFSEDYLDFSSRDTEIIGIVPSHLHDINQWLQDIEKSFELSGSIKFPVVPDPHRRLLSLFGVNFETYLNASIAPVHLLYIIDPDRVVQLVQILPASLGFNVLDLSRTVAALQAKADYDVLIPCNWTPGRDALLPTERGVSNETLISEPENVWEVLPYLKYVRIDDSVDNTSSVIGYENMRKDLMRKFEAYKEEMEEKNAKEKKE